MLHSFRGEDENLKFDIIFQAKLFTMCLYFCVSVFVSLCRAMQIIIQRCVIRQMVFQVFPYQIRKIIAEMSDFRMLSLNVRGLSNFKKRRAIFAWCRKQNANIIFLQETHSTGNNEKQWKAEWGAPLELAHGSSNLRGVAILF